MISRGVALVENHHKIHGGQGREDFGAFLLPESADAMRLSRGAR